MHITLKILTLIIGKSFKNKYWFYIPQQFKNYFDSTEVRFLRV